MGKFAKVFFEYIWSIGMGIYFIGFTGKINVNWSIISLGFVIIVLAIAGKVFLVEK